MGASIVQAVINGILIGGFYSLMGMGQNVIFGVMKIVNFCQGELLMCGMYLSYVFFMFFGIDPYLSIPLVALCLFGLGSLIQHSLITPSMSTKSFTNLLFLTVGLGILLQNLAQVIFSVDFLSVTTSYTSAVIDIAGVRIGIPKIVSFAALIVLTLVLFYFLKRTRVGKQIRATSQNPTGAQVVGINIKFIYVITYGLGALIAGLAGGLLLPFYTVYPQVGASFGLKALIVVIIGGLGNIKGAFFAGIFLGVLETVGAMIVGPSYKDLFIFLVFIIILVVRQQIKLREA